ncbi:MAG: hypothetical protein FWC40_01445 [Proteobacteria bacterium]|nr:hypothetical protein [Pseudomonadota bacterium]
MLGVRGAGLIIALSVLLFSCSPREGAVMSVPNGKEQTEQALSSELAAAEVSEAEGDEAVSSASEGEDVAGAAAESLPSDNDAPTLGEEDFVDDPEVVCCEVKLEHASVFFSAKALGPTIEEARDNAIEETCAIPCAELLALDSSQDDETLEAQLESCVELCAEEATVVAAACMQHGEMIYSEGAWREAEEAATASDEE